MVGRQISHYRIEAQLGEGGMGVVYRAVDLSLDRLVAVKMLTPELARNISLRERFQAEAKAQANLNHTNIATLYSFVQDGDTSFIVMEYVDGETFEEMIRRGPIPPGQAIPLFQQALSGLGFAHRVGIVHRDIKPGNLMVNRHGVVKVLDFGLAKVLGAQRTTRSGVRVGSVFYMSPEQIRNEPLDSRSDVYSLGVTLYEMLSGHVPFAGDSDYQVMADHVNLSPPPLIPQCPCIPARLEIVVLKALEKDRGRRFQTVEEFAAALEGLETTERTSSAQMPRTSAHPVRTPLAKFSLLGLAGIVMLALAFFAWRSRRSEGIGASLPQAVAAGHTAASSPTPVPDNPAIVKRTSEPQLAPAEGIGASSPQAVAARPTVAPSPTHVPDNPAAVKKTAEPPLTPREGIGASSPQAVAARPTVAASPTHAPDNPPDSPQAPPKPAIVKKTSEPPLAPAAPAAQTIDPHANNQVEALTPPLQQGAPDRRFDGTWDTVLSCENAGRALGYSYRFSSVVKEAALRGENGTKGKAGWLQLEGNILPDGSAKIDADGLVGSSDAALGKLSAGTPYHYTIAANFSGESGTGKRVEGRACSVTFTKKR